MAKSEKTAEPTLTVAQAEKIGRLKAAYEVEDRKYDKIAEKRQTAHEKMMAEVDELPLVFKGLFVTLPHWEKPQKGSNTEERQKFVIKTLRDAGGTMKEDDLKTAIIDAEMGKRLPQLKKIEGVSLDDGMVTLTE